MNFELWDMVSYGDGEELYPFTKLKESHNFHELYKIFLSHSKKSPCVIIVNNENDD